MPPERRTVSIPAKPVKTERTHEENQERAYIAASRRSDRSLEARIESARRASEIHKKRTGRALRVTEADVQNEEMYEEEDDDLPTQYVRLNAHLQSSSMAFNRKLQDYLATHQGIRSMFFSHQFPGQQMQPFVDPRYPPKGPQGPTMNSSMMPPQMMSPQTFSPTAQTFSPTVQTFSPTAQTFSPTAQTFNPTAQGFAQPFTPNSVHQDQHQQQQQQSYRYSPYNIPDRQNQRSASIPHVTTSFAPVQQLNSQVTASQAGVDRRLSLPKHPLEPAADGQARPSLSPAPTAQSLQQQQQPASPQHSLEGASLASTPGHATPQPKSEHASPTPHQFGGSPSSTGSQVLDTNPLSMSLPPESQQFVGFNLDPNDPRTSFFMAGSENLPQPFVGNYTYNFNPSPKSSQAHTTTALSTSTSGAHTLVPEHPIKHHTTVPSGTSYNPSSAMSDNMFLFQSPFTPGLEFSNFFENYQATMSNGAGDDAFSGDPLDDQAFMNWGGQ